MHFRQIIRYILLATIDYGINYKKEDISCIICAFDTWLGKEFLAFKRQIDYWAKAWSN
jgi:hypothetical protein